MRAQPALISRMKTPMTRLCLASLCWLALLPLTLIAKESRVEIRSNFPGGNVIVVRNSDGAVELAPDLRGGQSWFYWHFEAQAAEPGPVTFSFAGSPMIGVRGPAVSVDGGDSWNWLGAEHVQYATTSSNPAEKPRESFAYDFSSEHLTVRFAVAIPYLQRDLDRFIKWHETNPHLTQHTLTKTRRGTPIELLQIGEPSRDVRAMVVTARHHACESMASFVLEGFLHAAMSDSPSGIEFRKRHVLYAIPLVDKDGVQAGDQGKNRAPHDHNRDYGPSPLYPEILAIQELAEAQQVRYALDFHCPALRGDVHEAFHFLGLGVPHVSDNLNEFIQWIKEERPQRVMTPLNLLTNPAKPNAVDRRISSHYFALRDRAVFAATLEVPYIQRDVELVPALARAYGESMLAAWTRTTHLSADEESSLRANSYADLIALRTKATQTYRSKPAETETLLNEHLKADAAPVLRVEANNLMTLLRAFQKRFVDAHRHCDVVLADSHATTLQRQTATVQRLQVAVADPASTPQRINDYLQAVVQFPHVAFEKQAASFEIASQFYRDRKEYSQSIKLAQQQLTCALPHDRGRVLNRIASDYERLNQPEQAIAARQQAVQLLRQQLSPKPQRSIFGALMTVDLFEALCGIPTSTLEEKQTAAQLVFEHEIVSEALKQKVRATLTSLPQK